MRTAHVKKDKIHEALELLNDVAEERRAEIYEALGDKYEHLRDVLEGTVENGRDLADLAKKKLVSEEKKILKKAASIDKQIHREPWAYIGGVALGSLVLGMLLGRRK